MRTVTLGSSSTRVAHVVAGTMRIDRRSDDDVPRLPRAARDAGIDFFDHVGGAGDEHVDSGSGVGGGVGCGSRVVVGGEQSVAGSRCHIATLTGYGAAVFAIAHDGDVWAWGAKLGSDVGHRLDGRSVLAGEGGGIVEDQEGHGTRQSRVRAQRGQRALGMG